MGKVFRIDESSPVVIFTIQGKNFVFLIDTGASISIVAPHVARNVQLTGSTISVAGFSGETFITLGVCSLKLCYKKKHVFSSDFHVLPDEVCRFNADGVLGSDFFSKFQTDIKYSDNSLFFKNSRVSIPLLRPDEIVEYTFRPRSINYLQIMTNQVGDVFIETQKINDDVEIIGSVQSVNSGTLTLKVANKSSSKQRITNFNPIIRSLNDYDVFTNKNYINSALSVFKINKNDESKFEQLKKNLDLSNIEDGNKQKLLDVCRQYLDSFSDPNEPISAVKEFEQHIFIKPDTMPKYVKQYRLPPIQREAIAKKVRQMVEEDIAEPSTSAWNSPILIVPKKGATDLNDWRLVIDYRKVNDIVQDDRYPIQDISDILDGLSGSSLFSTLDLDQGYYQIKLNESSRPVTAFTTQDGHFQLKRMPMGMKTSPACFSRIMQTALSDLIGKICFVYLDDIIIYSKTIEEHFQRLATVLGRLSKIGLKVKAKKCNFLKPSVKFLGHIVSEAGVSPDPEKVEAVKNWPTPKNSKDIESFLGLASYYRKFIKNFAKIAQPIRRLTQNDVNFDWNNNCENSFETLKNLLTHPPILAFPDFSPSNKFILQTDASDFAIGAVLMNSDRRPITFVSRQLRKYEKNYGITDKELLAIVWAVKKLRQYLYGKKFEIETDHKALVFLYNMRDPNARQTRFRLTLEEFDFDINYIKGKSNIVADALSRIEIRNEDLKLAHLRITTRLQTKTNINNFTNRSIVTKVLREIDNCTLLKICVDENEIYEFSDNELFMDRKEVIGYFPDEDVIFIKVPLQLDENSLQNVTKYVIDGFNLLCSKFKLSKVSIMENEVKKMNGYGLRLLKSVGKSVKEINIYIIPEKIYVKDTRMKKSILEKSHSAPTGGHLGIEKTYRTIKLKYFWPKLKNDVRELIKNCPLCQTQKYSRLAKSSMTITDTASSRFERVFMDIVGPLPQAHSGNRYILSIQDDLTKFLEVFPIPNKAANTVARVLVEFFFLKYGFPKFLVSDCGSEFVSKIQKSVCELLKIEHITSAPYHHQTIGALENSHKSLNNFLRTFSDDDKFNWDLWLPYFSFCYNSNVHFATSYAPFELLFGENLNIPDGTLQTPTPVYDVDDFANELKSRLKIALDDARKCQIKEKEKRKLTYDNKYKTRDIEYVIGDFVVVKNETGNKLDNIFKGPYEIIKVEDKNLIIRVRNRNVKVNKDNVKIYNRLLCLWIEDKLDNRCIS